MTAAKVQIIQQDPELQAVVCNTSRRRPAVAYHEPADDHHRQSFLDLSTRPGIRGHGLL